MGVAAYLDDPARGGALAYVAGDEGDDGSRSCDDEDLRYDAALIY